MSRAGFAESDACEQRPERVREGAVRECGGQGVPAGGGGWAKVLRVRYIPAARKGEPEAGVPGAEPVRGK